MQQLAVLQLSNTSLNSALPAAWGSQLPSLQHTYFFLSGLKGVQTLLPTGIVLRWMLL